MQPQQIECFRELLTRMMQDILRSGHSTLEEMEQAGKEHLPDPADQASVESLREFTLRLRSREYMMARKIRQALARIEAGVYGRCESCGEEIGAARLRARPVTTLCIECKNAQERDESTRGE